MIERWKVLSRSGIALFLAAGNVQGQQPVTPDREAFLATARDAAERYTDRNRAIRDGYRRLGPDFPGMGQHWVHIGHIVAGSLDPDHPAALSYIQVGAEPRIVGLAYALPLAADELPPERPFGRERWHDHTGSVLEESLLLEHPRTVASTPSRFRLSMLHLWVSFENPAGLFEQNNWKLPFLRAGLQPPAVPPPLAAMGVSLSQETSDYYRELLKSAGEMDEDEEQTVDETVDRFSESVGRWITARRGRPLSRDDLLDLEVFWGSFWDELEDRLDPATFAAVRALRGGGADLDLEQQTF